MTSSRRVFRCIALALATAQLLAFAGAPVLERIAMGRDRGAQLSMGPLDAAPGAPVHDTGTCIACQIMGAVACLPQAAGLPVPGDAAPPSGRLTTAIPPQLAPRQGFLSRAPPALRV